VALGSMHHVIISGIKQGGIIRDNSDRTEFLYRVRLLAKTSGISIYAFALMTRHAHILLKNGSIGLSLYGFCIPDSGLHHSRWHVIDG
jgi:putative transposase